MKQESVQDLGVLGHFAKTDVRYWQRTIFRQTYTRNGQTLAAKNWAMKIAHVSRRKTFPAGTPNKAAPAAKARDIFVDQSPISCQLLGETSDDPGQSRVFAPLAKAIGSRKVLSGLRPSCSDAETLEIETRNSAAYQDESLMSNFS